MSASIRSVGLAALLALLGALSLYLGKAPNTIRGAVVTSDTDPSRELPIADVDVSIVGGPTAAPAHTDAKGFFAIPLPWHLRAGQKITLHFNRRDYRPLDVPDLSADHLCIARLVPLTQATPGAAQKPEVTIANLVVKYSMSTTRSVNIGSAVKSFQAVNQGNVACGGHRPCSPDGKWKAQEASATMDAGANNEFRNARASCIAGPCPFTRIQSPGVKLSSDGRFVRVLVLNWSDTATFLLEAEVYTPMVSNELRQSYPLIFGRALTFTLPGAAEGVSIEAELNLEKIVFPLGPTLFLTWADCQMVVNPDNTSVYRCELKPGFRFSRSLNTAETN